VAPRRKYNLSLIKRTKVPKQGETKSIIVLDNTKLCAANNKNFINYRASRKAITATVNLETSSDSSQETIIDLVSAENAPSQNCVDPKDALDKYLNVDPDFISSTQLMNADLKLINVEQNLTNENSVNDQHSFDFLKWCDAELDSPINCGQAVAATINEQNFNIIENAIQEIKATGIKQNLDFMGDFFDSPVASASSVTTISPPNFDISVNIEEFFGPCAWDTEFVVPQHNSTNVREERQITTAQNVALDAETDLTPDLNVEQLLTNADSSATIVQQSVAHSPVQVRSDKVFNEGQLNSKLTVCSLRTRKFGNLYRKQQQQALKMGIAAECTRRKWLKSFRQERALVKKLKASLGAN